MCFNSIKDTKPNVSGISTSSSEISTYKNPLFLSSKIRLITNKIDKKYDLFISVIDLNDNDVIEDYIQYVLALCSIEIGGIILIKSNNIHILFKLWMISVVSRYFNNSFLIKPESSMAYNSDIYFLGNDFKGISRNDIDKLYHVLSTFKKAYINKNLSEVYVDTIQLLYKAILEIINREIDTKEKNMVLYNNVEDLTKYYYILEKRTIEVMCKYILDFEITHP